MIHDDVFFNRNWVRACRGRWAGPRLLVGWVVGSWIVWDEVGLLQCWSIKQERRGVGEGFARGRSDA